MGSDRRGWCGVLLVRHNLVPWWGGELRKPTHVGICEDTCKKKMQWSQVAVNNIIRWHSLNNSQIEMQGNMSGEFKAYLPCWLESGRNVHCCGGIVDLSKHTLQHLDKDYTNIVEKHGRT